MRRSTFSIQHSVSTDATIYVGLGVFFSSQVSSLVQWYSLYTSTFLHVYIQGEMVPTSQESPVYWGGQEHCSTVFAGPPVPSRLVSSRPTSPMPSRCVWVKYRAWILSPTKSARAIISSSLETGLLLIAWRQFPCRSELCTSDLTWWACRWKRWVDCEGSSLWPKRFKCFLHL